MKAKCSFSSGICVLVDDSNRVSFVDVLEGCMVQPEIQHVALGNTLDWEHVEALDHNDLCEKVKEGHRLLRALLNIEQCLDDIRTETALDLLQEEEELLQLGVSRTALCSRLLVGPLRDPERMRERAKLAVANGLGAVADLLETIIGSQPLISRIVGHWLEIPESEFASVPGGRKALWELAEMSGTLFQLVQATNHDSFKLAWSRISLSQPQPQSRSASAHIAAILTDRVFPRGLMNRERGERPQKQVESVHEDYTTAAARQKLPAGIEKERALKQVKGIVDAVARGDDTMARKFLRELVASQSVRPDQAVHAVKSLCNVAQQCADLYRTDFERECLGAALEIDSSDAWALIQCGDHYKRVGEYRQAMDFFNQARVHGERLVVLSAIADIYSQKGDYLRAIEEYKSIPDSESDERIRTAIADNMRRLGRFADAIKEYNFLIGQGTHVDRAYAGLAEIAKREGRLEEAEQKYVHILSSVVNVDDRSRQVYRCSLIGVLMRRGHLDRAHRLVDQVLSDSPFCMYARILRASILGLQGKARDAVKSFPARGAPAAFGEWVQQYVRGLLLLQLQRYADAQQELIRNLDAQVLEGENIVMLRLAAAVFFLAQKGGILEAKRRLRALPDVSDAYAKYLSMILRFHVAMAEKDAQEIQRLDDQLSRAELPRGPLQGAYNAIHGQDWRKACRLEIAALLRCAA